ncbi:MAG: family 10 glycosylhydrolase, partial [Lachnospiraceae bacterium]|nr:family 10 glycosylhydrolase [Lachnospiraceae bacterium]
KEEVQEYLLDTVEELVSNYDVDGVHFDDYFYPTLDDSDSELSFDLEEYELSGSGLSVADWRRENVSGTVKKIYERIKSVDESVEFGVSPAGNLDNLDSDTVYFTEIKTWMAEEGYVDYVIPQIYWGFEQRNRDGSLSPSAYENCLNRWSEIPRRDGLNLYIGLALYRCGLDINDNNTVSEWLSYNDIIKRQVESLRQKENVGGFSLFDYRDLSRVEAETEVENLYNFISSEEDN